MTTYQQQSSHPETPVAQVIVHQQPVTIVETSPYVIDSLSPAQVDDRIQSGISDLRQDLTAQNKLFDHTIQHIFQLDDLVKQAEYTQRVMSFLYEGSAWLIARLGQTIIMANDRHLYSYLNYGSMREWLESIGIDEIWEKKAMLSYRNADFFFGHLHLPAQRIVTASTAQVTALADLNGKVDASIQERISKELPRSAPRDVRKQRYEELLEEQRPEIEARAQRILESKPNVLQKERRSSLGIEEKSLLVLQLDVDPKDPHTVHITGSLPFYPRDTPDLENNAAWIQSGYTVRFQVPGREKHVSYQELPELLLDRAEALHGTAIVEREFLSNEIGDEDDDIIDL